MRATRRSPYRMLIVGAVIALLSIPAIGAGAADDQPQIGFVSGENPLAQDLELYVSDADGMGRVGLTADFGSGQHWAWSPDGSRVAFFSGDSGNETLYVRDLDEAQPFVVAAGTDPYDGWAWSPDSTRIAYVSMQDGDADVHVANVETGTIIDLPDNPWDTTGPRWSPDGSQIVFVTNRDGNDDIYVADGDGRNPVRLTTSPANDRDPAWSPDGTQIAFSSGLETRDESSNWVVVIPSRIYVMDADGSNRRALSDGSIDPDPDPRVSRSLSHSGPTWSLDGSRLAFAVATNRLSAHGRHFTIYTVDPTGGGSPVEIWSDGGGWSLWWSPDGARLAIQSTGNYAIDSTTVIAAADGSGVPVTLTVGAGSSAPSWSTYGTHLEYATATMSSRSDVYVAAPDGTAERSITSGLAGRHNFSAAWRPQPLGPVGLVDPSAGRWYLRDEWGVIDSFYYGDPGDVPFLGDWDGDGVETPGLYRRADGYVYLRNANTQGNADIRFFFGNPGDVPLAGDFDGDGFDTVSIYRPPNQTFYIINELGDNDGGLGAAEYSFVFGNPGDQPVVGDWDGDGVDEIGLHRASTGFFYYRNTLTTGTADAEFYFGDPGDRFVAGDWGIIDGRDTPAVFRPSNTVFYFRHTLTQGTADSQFTWPAATADWIPVAGTYSD